MASEDGIAAVALGMGRAVVEGGKCLSFCPRYPQSLIQFSAVKDILANSQSEFWALELNYLRHDDPMAELREVRFGSEAAETDGTLSAGSSTYSRDKDAGYDGLIPSGLRNMSGSSVLNPGIFPPPR